MISVCECCVTLASNLAMWEESLNLHTDVNDPIVVN